LSKAFQSLRTCVSQPCIGVQSSQVSRTRPSSMMANGMTRASSMRGCSCDTNARLKAVDTLNQPPEMTGAVEKEEESDIRLLLGKMKNAGLAAGAFSPRYGALRAPHRCRPARPRRERRGWREGVQPITRLS